MRNYNTVSEIYYARDNKSFAISQCDTSAVQQSYVGGCAAERKIVLARARASLAFIRARTNGARAYRKNIWRFVPRLGTGLLASYLFQAFRRHLLRKCERERQINLSLVPARRGRLIRVVIIEEDESRPSCDGRSFHLTAIQIARQRKAPTVRCAPRRVVIIIPASDGIVIPRRCPSYQIPYGQSMRLPRITVARQQQPRARYQFI